MLKYHSACSDMISHCHCKRCTSIFSRDILISQIKSIHNSKSQAKKWGAKVRNRDSQVHVPKCTKRTAGVGPLAEVTKNQPLYMQILNMLQQVVRNKKHCFHSCTVVHQLCH